MVRYSNTERSCPAVISSGPFPLRGRNRISSVSSTDTYPWTTVHRARNTVSASRSNPPRRSPARRRTSFPPPIYFLTDTRATLSGMLHRSSGLAPPFVAGALLLPLLLGSHDGFCSIGGRRPPRATYDDPRMRETLYVSMVTNDHRRRSSQSVVDSLRPWVRRALWPRGATSRCSDSCIFEYVSAPERCARDGVV